MGLKAKIFSKSNIINFQNSFLYFGGSIIQLLISLVTFPIYSTYLSSEEFGIIGYFTSFMQFFTPLFVLSTTNIYVMKYFRQTKSENESLLFNLLFFLTLINILTYIISYIGLYFYFRVAKVNIPFYPYTLIILATIFFEVFRTFALMNYRIRKRALPFFLLSSVGPVLNAAFSIVLIVYFNGGAVGRLSGVLLAKFIVAIISIIILKQWMLYKIDFRLFKKSIYLAAPLIFSSYAFIPIQSFDKILLERNGNISELGIYTIGSQVAGFLNMAFVAFFQAFEPDIYKNVVKGNKKKLINVILIFIGVLFIGIIAFIISSKTLIDLMTRGRYISAYIYANIIAVGAFLTGINRIVTSIILAYEKTRYASYITYIGGISAIVFYYFLISKWNFIGASIGRTIVPLIMVLTGIYFLFKIKKQNIKFT